jgi:apolipoprotein N-acyltransferase
VTTTAETRMRSAVFGSSVALRMGLGLVLSAVSGVMLLLAFPPYGVWPLAWVAFAPYLFAQHRLLPRKWSSLAPGIATLLWLGPFLGRLFGTEVGAFYQYLGVLIAILVFLLKKERTFHERTDYRWFILQGVIDWVGFEMIRATFVPLIATSAFIGYTQATQPWLIQPVSIFSVYGLNLVIMLCNFALAQGAMAWFDRRWHPADVVMVDGRATRNWLAATGVIVAAWIGLSLVILSGAPRDAPTVRVAALQPNYPVPAFQDEVNTSEIRFATFAEQAQQAAQQGAQILFTPEMMFNFDPQVEYTEQLRDLAEETGAYIFVTYTVAKEGEDFRNEAVLLSPSGEFLAVYGKNHAFGEPPTALRGVFPVHDTPLGRLATLICHDANYTDIARKLTRNGAQIIAAPIREFGGFGEQYWTNALFRAVENRSAMVVSGVAKVSAIIEPNGSLVALDVNPDGARVTLVGDVTLGSDNAPYTSLGDWLGWASLAAYVFFVAFQIVVGGRAKKPAQS